MNSPGKLASHAIARFGAIATQARGHGAGETLAIMLRYEPQPGLRQVDIIDRDGNTAA